jgi:DNA-binding transcriptional LysR family regulator
VCVDDHFVDIVGEGYDAGIRLVEAIDRDMIHVRLLGECRLVVAGAPSYFKRRGVPQKPEDLLQHECICMRWTKGGEPWAWELERGKRNWRVPVRGPVTTNDSSLMRTLGI